MSRVTKLWNDREISLSTKKGRLFLIGLSFSPVRCGKVDAESQGVQKMDAFEVWCGEECFAIRGISFRTNVSIFRN